MISCHPLKLFSRGAWVVGFPGFWADSTLLSAPGMSVVHFLVAAVVLSRSLLSLESLPLFRDALHLVFRSLIITYLGGDLGLPCLGCSASGIFRFHLLTKLRGSPLHFF